MTTPTSLYKKLLKHFGRQYWWPAETPFEVMVGAILTQQTNWGNALKAIENLKREKLLSPQKIQKTPNSKLHKVIRSSGYFKQKAKKLKIFCNFFLEEFGGSIKKIKAESLNALRPRLLELWGIGRETADSILLYALDKPVFVVDAYTIRVGERIPMFKSEGYEHVRSFFESKIPKSIYLYKEYHALLVELGKNYCRKKPNCKSCPIRKSCKYSAKL